QDDLVAVRIAELGGLEEVSHGLGDRLETLEFQPAEVFGKIIDHQRQGRGAGAVGIGQDLYPAAAGQLPFGDVVHRPGVGGTAEKALVEVERFDNVVHGDAGQRIGD